MKKTANAKLDRLVMNESGITALETAIIMIAFVVVAAIFAFSILSTGTSLTERSKEAAYAGLQEVRGSMEMKGSVVLESTGDYVVFHLTTVVGGSTADLSKVVITYRDTTNNMDIAYSALTTYPLGDNWIATTPDGKAPISILGPGQFAKIVVNPSPAITANTTFALEIKPPQGSVLLIERTAPAKINKVTDLH